MTAPAFHPEIIDGKAVQSLKEAQAIRSATVLGRPGGWAVLVRYGALERAVAAQRAHTPRIWRTLPAAAAFVQGQLGLARFEVDAAGFEPDTTPRRPDQAATMKRAHQAAAYDAWFREQVQIGLDAANAGDLITSEDMEAEAETWCNETRRQMAGGSKS